MAKDENPQRELSDIYKMLTRVERRVNGINSISTPKDNPYVIHVTWLNWIIIGVLLTSLLWLMTPAFTGKVTSYGQALLSVLVVLFLSWFLFKALFYLIGVISGKGFSLFAFIPTSVSGIAISFLAIGVLVLGMYSFGPSWDTIKSKTGALWGSISEYLPIGTLVENLNGVASQTSQSTSGLPTGAGSGDLLTIEISPGITQQLTETGKYLLTLHGIDPNGAPPDIRITEGRSAIRYDFLINSAIDLEWPVYYQIEAEGNKLFNNRGNSMSTQVDLGVKCWTKLPVPFPAHCNVTLPCRSGTNPVTKVQQEKCPYQEALIALSK